MRPILVTRCGTAYTADPRVAIAAAILQGQRVSLPAMGGRR